MKQFIKDYFTFNKAEKNGIIFLVVLIVLILSATFIVGQLDLTGEGTSPEIEEKLNELTSSAEGTNVPWDSTNTPQKVQFPININQADTAMLKHLTGVGPALALRIIQNRDSLGGFTSMGQLLNVKGIGPKKLEGFKGEVIIEAVNKVNLVDEN